MSEEQQEQEIDLEALQANIDESQVDDVENNEELDAGQEIDEQEDEPEFNLEKALDDAANEEYIQNISLTGKLSDEDADKEAMDRGWRKDGEDKFGHKITAIEFLERTPFFRKQELMRGDINELKAQNKKIIEQSKLIAKNAIDEKAKLLEGFKAEREELLNSELMDKDDIEKLRTIDKNIEDNSVDDGLSESQNDVVNAYEERKDQFMKDNDWYNSNRAMTSLADNLGKDYIEDYHKKHDELPDPSDLFDYVLDEIKKDFPDMGKPKRETRVASRSTRTVHTNHKKGKTLDDIPEDQRAVAKMVMESAGLSEEEYLKTYEF